MNAYQLSKNWSKIPFVIAIFSIMLLHSHMVSAASIEWKWVNKSNATIHVELYSQKRNHVWPGSGKVWVVPPNRKIYSNSISCHRGEKICYGAWFAKNKEQFWGGGKGGEVTCQKCCYSCGAGRTTILSFGGKVLPANSDKKRCFPNKLGARIFSTADSNDIHPDWIPPNAIGTSWSLINVKEHGAHLSGNIVSPRGGVQTGRVYVVTFEWQCNR